MTRKWLSPTAVTQKQAIVFIQNPFKLIPVANIAEIADKFTRAQVLSSNEIRSIIGYKPVADERANELSNPNLNKTDEQLANQILTDSGEGDTKTSQSDPSDPLISDFK